MGQCKKKENKTVQECVCVCGRVWEIESSHLLWKLTALSLSLSLAFYFEERKKNRLDSVGMSAREHIPNIQKK